MIGWLINEKTGCSYLQKCVPIYDLSTVHFYSYSLEMKLNMYCPLRKNTQYKPLSHHHCVWCVPYDINLIIWKWSCSVLENKSLCPSKSFPQPAHTHRNTNVVRLWWEEEASFDVLDGGGDPPYIKKCKSNSLRSRPFVKVLNEINDIIFCQGQAGIFSVSYEPWTPIVSKVGCLSKEPTKLSSFCLL